MAISPAIVTLLFLVIYGFIIMETDLRSINRRFEKFSFCSSSIESLSLLFYDYDSDDEFTCLHFLFRFYTYIFIAAICKLSGENLVNILMSFKALLSLFF